MIYDIDHLTAYAYDEPVMSATLALRLTPRNSELQRKLGHTVRVDPPPDHIAVHDDFFGNAVDVVTIDTKHTELIIKSSARVERLDRPSLIGENLSWERVAQEALSRRDLSGSGLAHFLFPSPLISLERDVAQYAQESFPEGRGIFDACTDLMTRIRNDFEYETTTTEVSTTVAQAFAQRSGVCQDFAQIMISGLRGLGLPAAYVSGYLRTIPPPGEERLQGADATHAWVSVWTGEVGGWIGFDPTNAIHASTDHVDLAVGRDFSDVSPVHGVFVGSGAHQLRVEVDVVPVEGNG
ncbi:transglutaminase family protein [Methyloceanibacter caenitepidi]|uniref:Protein containing transglutaminase-like domain, putative cysteine protease n=1 Tax=Methyloceanibacter caenitepidi TaxID=1384459 RepID=A0A0A8K987_9HYPH|nr:transglutaminase family protein [Methyloceanibacter caenitepidi]BAQ18624.1 protein containing transglutaminase-like domain, putative cysteine protease [Methyloceanibacter caenitepidi]